MKIFELSIIGQFHLNHNEDFSVINEIGKDKLLIAVMDGCSMGIESHFSSTLIGKILRKIAKGEHYLEFIQRQERPLKVMLKNVLESLFSELVLIKNQLDLEVEELLSTMILGVVDLKENKCELIAIGDGLVAHNGFIREFDQDNKPDYVGYHLNENFEDWFEKQEQFLSLSCIQDLCISTDGIFTFKPFDNKAYKSIREEELINLLLKDSSQMQNEHMLLEKLTNIEKEWGLKPSDDLTLIRLIK